MTSLLGVPISLGGRILGDLYLTDKISAEEFDDVGAGSAEGHHGLRNMTNRARMLQEHLDPESAPGRGTTLTLELPLSS